MIEAKRILQIGFVTQDPRTGAKMKEFISKRDGVDLRLVESSSVTVSAAPAGISVFVYDLDASSEASLKEFDRFMVQRPQDIPVIVLSPAVDDELVRWFLRLRVADWIKTPLSSGELIAACGRVISQASARKQDLKYLTFMGARGGAGATTLAIHAAMILSSRTNPPVPTCLIDLDLNAGACSDYLDLAPGWQINELLADPARLDAHMLDTMIVRHAKGISVLSAQCKFHDPLPVAEEIVTRALDLATQKFPNLVIDLPRHPESWTDSVLLGSSQVFVVTEFTIPGLKAAKRLTSDIAGRFGDEVTPKVIVNKYGRTFFGTGLSMHEVKEVLGASFAGSIAEDSKLVREAINRGIPTTELKKKNAVITGLTRILGA
jgi:pilus assembly protein CpaE